jgi:hypothetical protein
MPTFLYILFVILFALLFLTYYCLVVSYTVRNCKKKKNKPKSNVYWMEFFILKTGICLLLITYLVELMLYNDEGSGNDRYDNFNQFMEVVLLILMLIGINNLSVNFCKSILLYCNFCYIDKTLDLLKKEETQESRTIKDNKESKSISEILIEPNIPQNILSMHKIRIIFNQKIHIMFYIFLLIIDGVIIFLFVKYYVPDITSYLTTLSKYLVQVLKYFLFFMCYVFSITNIIILNRIKTLVENKSNIIFNNDNFIDILCNNEQLDKQGYSNQEKIGMFLVFTDFLIYKTILDIVFNSPFFIMSELVIPNDYLFILTLIIWCFYVILISNLYFTMDTNFGVKLNMMFKNFFFSKLFFINLGNTSIHLLMQIKQGKEYKMKKNAKIKKGPKNNKIKVFNRKEDETVISNSNIFLNSDSNVSNSEPMINNLNSIGNLNLYEDYPELFNSQNSNSAKFYIPVNFFIIFKMLHSYYKNNERVFDNFEKTVKMRATDECRSSVIERNSNIMHFMENPSEFGDLKSKISKPSQISMTKFILTNLMSVNYNFLFNNIEDTDMKEQFDKYVFPGDLNSSKAKARLEKHPNSKNNIKSHKKMTESSKKLNFSLESLYTDNLKELLPIYQIYCKDIIESLDPQKNKKVCRTLFEKKYSEKNYNHFFTINTFLNFEIYDLEEIELNQNNVKEFIEKYQIYLTRRYRDWKQTFLPLILGVFQIKFFNYDKLVILYRHPLAFSPFLVFKYWINISLSDTEEKVAISTSSTEIINVKEIEVKDNIRIHQDDYKEVYEDILTNDFKFIQSLSFKARFFTNVFIINDIQQFLSNNSHWNSQNNSENLNNNNNNIHQAEEISEAKMFPRNHNSKDFPDNLGYRNSYDIMSQIRKTEFFRDTDAQMMHKRSKREHGSEVLSIMDKLLTNYVVNTRYMIKIYFADLFNFIHDQVGFDENLEQRSFHCQEYNRNYCFM